MADFAAVAVVYAAVSRLPRGGIASDNSGEFEAACRAAATDGCNVLDLTRGLLWRDGQDKPESHPEAGKLLNLPNDGGIERLAQIVAAFEGVDVSDIPSGRCAVVLPETREVIEFVVADPALDAIGEAHQIGGDCACELHATEDAKLGDKITEDGERLARVVTGDRDGKVEAVEWVDPKAIPEGAVEDSFAKPGETVEALKLTDVASEGTVKL